MTRIFRLRTSREVRAVLQEGFATRGPLFVVRSRHGGEAARVAVVASKKRVGNAVRRNRVRRRLRAAAGEAGLPNGDYVFIASASVLDAPFGQLVQAARRLTPR